MKAKAYDPNQKQYVAFSGGKDSTAMLLRMIELGERIDGIFFADTGEEWQLLTDYIKQIEKLINREITILPPAYSLKEGMQKIVSRGKHEGQYRGFPTALMPCYFMRDTKYTPMTKMSEKGIICIGYATGEENRAKNLKSNIRTPLMEWGWTEERCVEYLNEKSLLNPLYTNFNRLGCIPCPKQNIGSLYVIWKQHKDKWEYIRELNVLQNKLRGEDIKFVNGSFTEIDNKFENGFVPRKRPKYACYECKGVTKAFTDQISLCDFQDFDKDKSEHKRD